ncbi:MAG: heme exporter protein CcmB [Deltaproteobacteria bacterium]|nr:heme exporter protein CcmB [Deltaproteobacteria bacterium]
MRTLAAIGLILKKDVLVELRTREVILTMALFSVLVVVIFAFTFQLGADVVQQVAPGILWVTLAFSGNLGISRVVDREREHGAMQGLLLGPAGPVAVYFAKMLGVLVFMLVTQIIVVPLALLFVGIEVPEGGIDLLVGALVLGSIGFAVVGTLFGAMLADVRLREVLIPVLVYPVVVPVIVAGVSLSACALGLAPPEDARDWLLLVVGFDLVYLAIAPWVFARVMVD